MDALWRSEQATAQQAFDEGRFDEAAEAFARAAGLRREALVRGALRDDADEALIDLGTCEARSLFKSARYDEARAAAELWLARALAAHGEDHALTVEARIVLGSVFVRRGRMDLAMAEFGAAFDATERGASVPEGTRGMLLNNLAGGAYAQGDLDAAIGWLERSLAHFDRHLGVGHVRSLPPLQNLAWMLAEASRFVESAAYARRVEEVAADLPEEHPNHGIIQATLASVAYATGRDLEAVERYERAFAVLPPGDELNLGGKLNLGSIYHNLGDLETAARYARAAIAYADSYADARHPQRVSAYRNLARVLTDQGDVQGAKHALDQALLIDRDALPGDRGRRYETLAARAEIEMRMGDADRAVESAEAAFREASEGEGVTPREVVRMRATLGAAHHAAGRGEAAVAALQAAVAEAHELGLLRTELGRGILDRLVQALVAVGDRVAARDRAEALIESAHAGRREAFALLDHMTRIRRTSRLRRAFEVLLGDSWLDPSVDQGDRERWIGYWLSHKHAATAAASALLRIRSQDDDTAVVLDAYRATLRGSAIDVFGTDASGDEAGGDAGAARLRTIETALGRRALDVLDEAVAPISAADVRSALARDDAYLDVAWLERSVVVTVIDHHGPVTSVRAGSVDELAAMVSAARSALERHGDEAPAAEGGDRTDHGAAAQWHGLVAPLLAGRPTPKRLFVSPDGPLSLIPWGAFMGGAAGVRDARAVVLSPSPRSFVRTGRRDEGPSEVRAVRRAPRTRAGRALGPPLVLADPDFGARSLGQVGARSSRGGSEPRAVLASSPYRAWLKGLRLPRLQHTRTEADVVRAVWPDARVLLGPQATVSALIGAQRPRALHIASHGFVYPGSDDVHPLVRPVLALAGARAAARDKGVALESAFLPALALLGLDVDGTELVVLSACSTSLGDLLPGEGVAGMAQALLTAGVGCVIATLWRVPDEASLEVMRGLYAGLATGSTPEVALAHVQRTARGAASHAAEAFVVWA